MHCTFKWGLPNVSNYGNSGNLYKNTFLQIVIIQYFYLEELKLDKYYLHYNAIFIKVFYNSLLLKTSFQLVLFLTISQTISCFEESEKQYILLNPTLKQDSTFSISKYNCNLKSNTLIVLL